MQFLDHAPHHSRHLFDQISILVDTYSLYLPTEEFYKIYSLSVSVVRTLGCAAKNQSYVRHNNLQCE